MATKMAFTEIEPIQLTDDLELEAFMNEKVLIYLHPSREAGELDVPVPSVNGINQPIIRGQDIAVRRKYVESLARCHTIRYEQQVMDPRRPENIQIIERKVSTYPFEVRKDTDKGRAWLKAIFASL